jgi:hypothetical protein
VEEYRPLAGIGRFGNHLDVFGLYHRAMQSSQYRVSLSSCDNWAS